MKTINQRPQPKFQRHAVNERIRAREVRVIDDKGEQLGVMPTEQALQLARERELDLVEVQPNIQPPVARILDFGQWQYQQTRQQTKKAKKVEVKTIKLSLKIGQHDIEVRQKQADKFLSKGDRVRLALRLRGRERDRKALAQEIIQNFMTGLGYGLSIDKPLSFLGAELSITFGKK